MFKIRGNRKSLSNDKSMPFLSSSCRRGSTLSNFCNYLIIVFINTLLLSILFIIGCNDTDPVSPDALIISNLASVKNKILTSYSYTDAVSDDKNDSLQISFDCNRTQLDITIESSLDSGVSWFILATIKSNDIHCSYFWSPVDNMLPQYEFCGGKYGLIRITCDEYQLISDTLVLLGSLPFSLESPMKNDTLAFNDTIQVIITNNLDVTSQITPSFRLVDRSTAWIAFGDIEYQFEKSFSNVILKKYIPFIPADFADQADNFSKPISMRIEDYSKKDLIPIIIDTLFINN